MIHLSKWNQEITASSNQKIILASPPIENQFIHNLFSANRILLTIKDLRNSTRFRLNRQKARNLMWITSKISLRRTITSIFRKVQESLQEKQISFLAKINQLETRETYNRKSLFLSKDTIIVILIYLESKSLQSMTGLINIITWSTPLLQAHNHI